MKEDKKTICKVAILCGQRVLALKRSRWVIYHPHRWDIPGGAMDDGESLEEVAARECFEEAGLIVDPSKLKLIDRQSKMRDGKPAERFCFAHYIDKEFKPKLSFEHSKHRWIDVAGLDEIDLPDFYKDVIRKSLEVKVV